MIQIVVLLLLVGQCLAQQKVNQTEEELYCDLYVECMAEADRKAADCFENATASERTVHENCEGVLKLQSQLQTLYHERNVQMLTCVRQKSSEALKLNQRKIKKCRALRNVCFFAYICNVPFKMSRSTSTDGGFSSMKSKSKKEKTYKTKICLKDAKKLRTKCSKISKCCSVVKDCHIQKGVEIAEKKKQLKALYKTCHTGVSKKKTKTTQAPVERGVAKRSISRHVFLDEPHQHRGSSLLIAYDGPIMFIPNSICVANYYLILCK
ncbi:hypothetical protein DICVIV_09208 [Dictyocaulus viviparus]|uniref:Cysteine rich repeat-containing domain protein n=1 Tax=Dictyocaulus viviparus TaxID=29172 RepID=A0A0D8XLU1_DICVI|nr:hypothetical protein DICVIV_09208 [Dictyocaulus viviparus]